MNKLIIFNLIFFSISFSQWFDINVDGVERTYLITYPPNSTEPCPLIINIHGYSGYAVGQHFYADMEDYSFPQNIAVVYPQGMPNVQGVNSWNVGTNWDGNFYDDVGFISQMIDDINENFDIDLNRVYACGMSNGGYMAYELACELSDKITAFGSVTGNFMLNENQSCNPDREIPIIHLHGTADDVVGYYPPSFDGSMTVLESIEYWTDFNQLNNIEEIYLNENVEKITYYKESSNTKFVHIKVNGGAHDWFGNSWGFHSSEELINFFIQYQLTDFVNIIVEGDVNGDEIVNILDIIQTINIILGTLPSNELADLNEDGIVNIVDILLIVNIVLQN